MRITAHAIERYRQRINPSATYGDVKRALGRSVLCDYVMARAGLCDAVIVRGDVVRLDLVRPCYFIVANDSVVTAIKGPDEDAMTFLRKRMESVETFRCRACRQVCFSESQCPECDLCANCCRCGREGRA